MKWSKREVAALLLAALLALAPAPGRAGSEPAPETSGGAARLIKYVACAGSIVFVVPVPGSIFYTALVCISAFVDSVE